MAPYGSRRRRMLMMIWGALFRGQAFRLRHLGIDDVLHRITPRPVRKLLRGSIGIGRIELWKLQIAARLRRGKRLDAGKLLEEARVELRTGRLPQAERLFASCRQADPLCLEAYRSLAWIQTARGDYFKASHTLYGALAVAPGSRDVQLQLAGIYLAGGVFWEASRILREILKAVPDHVEAALLLADLSMSDARYEEAARLYQSVLDRDPENLSARVGIEGCRNMSAEGAEKGAPSTNSAVNLVSIIIPVWDQPEHTRNCLDSIRKTDYANVEVLVTDNGSQPETAEYLRTQRSWITVIRNEENLGFVKASNQGAERASGAFLLFLNNDAVLSANAVSTLVRTAESDSGIGAVAVKLLYPTGILQEAGGIVFSNGTAWNYGKGDDAQSPEYNYVRDTAYGSAACLLVRTDAFRAAGGFDDRYSPGYFEDTDLAFALRKAGYRVVYQPEAEVIHVEGATAGTDLAAGQKRFQTIHQEKFKQKWIEELKTQPEFRPATVRISANQGAKRRILFIDHYLPVFDRSSGEHRTFQMLKLLKLEGHDVTYIARNGEFQRRYKRALQQAGVETFATDPQRMLSWDYETQARRIDLADLLRRREFSLAILSRYQIAEVYLPILKKHAPGLPVLVDSVDIHFMRARSKAILYQEKQEEADQIRASELAVYHRSDGVITVTEEERSVLLSESFTKPVFVIPNIHPAAENPPPFAERKDLLFVGNFLHPPNSDAMIYFCGEILPHIRAKLPGVRLWIVGANSFLIAGEMRQKDVIVTGYVPSTVPFLRSCRVSVAPLRYGAGMKGKIGEALSNGLPVVTTPVGAEGMNLRAEEHLLVEEDPLRFADAVVRLYSEEALWNRLSESGRRHIETNYSPQSVKPLIQSMLESTSK